MNEAELKPLIAAAQGGDRSSFETLIRAFVPRVHRFLVVTGLSSDEADDITQDTFLRAHQHLGSYDGRASFSTWLFTIGHRLRLNWIERRRKHADLAAAELVESSAKIVLFDESGVWALARRILPTRYFQVLWLRYGEDCDIVDIARVIDTSRLNVKVLLHRARGRIAKALGKENRMSSATSIDMVML